VAARSKARTVFARSNARIVGSNPTWGMDVCLRLICVCGVLCAGSGLATGWSPVQGETEKAAKNQQGYRATDEWFSCKCAISFVFYFQVNVRIAVRVQIFYSPFSWWQFFYLLQNTLCRLNHAVPNERASFIIPIIKFAYYSIVILYLIQLPVIISQYVYVFLTPQMADIGERVDLCGLFNDTSCNYII
jgi:hypothetical protein